MDEARHRATEFGLNAVPVYDDLGKALDDSKAEWLSICTPQHLHCENVCQAAAAGKHLIIEKPAGISLEELRSMRDAVREAGVKTVVSFVLRWNPLFCTLKSLMQDGALGKSVLCGSRLLEPQR